MENLLLNRIGIILNFAAGFMLAPELIGLERIARAEIWLEKQSELWKGLVDRRYKTILPIAYVEVRDFDVKTGCLLPVFSFVVTALLWGFVIGPNIKLATKITLISFVGIFLVVSAFLTGIAEVTQNDKYKVKNIFAIILFVILYRTSSLHFASEIYPYLYGREFVIGMGASIPYMVVNTLLNWSVLSLYLMIAYIPKVFYNVFSFIRKTLEGDERLKSIVVSTGIVIYILGNLLQFIATF
jgi:hypothetical protein